MISLVGFTGKAGAGKNAAAARLVNDGWVPVAFADPIKQIALQVDPYVKIDTRYWVRITEFVEAFGWEHAKTFPDVRRMLQRVGTEAGRSEPLSVLSRTANGSVWNDLAEHSILRALRKNRDVVVTDVRFDDEAKLIWKHGGVTIRIVRPATKCTAGETETHVSEQGINDRWVSETIVNDGSLMDLRDSVDRIVGRTK